MPDPINGVNSGNPIIIGSAGQSSSSPITPPNPAPPVAGSDSADVGQTQALLQTITQAANDVPSIDEARVGELRQAIASGTYEPNPQAIAEHLLSIEGVLPSNGPAS